MTTLVLYFLLGEPPDINLICETMSEKTSNISYIKATTVGDLGTFGG